MISVLAFMILATCTYDLRVLHTISANSAYDLGVSQRLVAQCLAARGNGERRSRWCYEGEGGLSEGKKESGGVMKAEAV